MSAAKTPDMSANEAQEERFLWSPGSLHESVHIERPPSLETTGKSIPNYASFGEDGTTVSVNKYGHIMQISRYFGCGPSGFFCVDQGSFDEPYYVQDRMEQIMDCCNDSSMGIKLDLDYWTENSTEPSLGFMYDRWPRFTYNRQSSKSIEKMDGSIEKVDRNDSKEIPESGAPSQSPTHQASDTEKGVKGSDSPNNANLFTLSIQYFIHQGTVVQKYLINIGKDGVSVEDIKHACLSVPICIRNLDFLREEGYNDSSAFSAHETIEGSENTYRIVHSFTEDMLKSPDTTTQERDQHKQEEEQQDGKEKEKESGGERNRIPSAAALYISIFMDDKRVPLGVDGSIMLGVTNQSSRQIEITVTYRLVLLDEKNEPLDFPLNVPILERDNIHNVENAETSNAGPLKQREGTSSKEVGNTLERLGEKAGDQAGEHQGNKFDQSFEVSQGELQSNNETSGKSASESEFGGNTVAKMIKADGSNDQMVLKSTIAKDQMKIIFSNSNPYKKLCFSEDPHFDYIFRRNLEHILSVCCIPVEPPAVTSLLPCIAITCGDISGHRIGPEAGLSAIKFLNAILTYLSDDKKHDTILFSTISRNVQKDTDISRKNQQIKGETAETEGTSSETSPAKAYLKSLKQCVEQTILAHIVWVVSKAGKTEGDNTAFGNFSAHYWPSGMSMNKGSNEYELDWLPRPSITDTPLQLLKILASLDLLSRSSIDFRIGSLDVKEALSPNIHSWLEKLHELNQRGTYAFSRNVQWYDNKPPDERKYGLREHVMISLALKLAEKLEIERPQDFRKYYRYDDVREKVLKRFTTENVISKQRMLATSRWKDKTRFLLHSKDTFLFDATDKYDFFTSTTSQTKSKSGSKRSRNKGADPWNYTDDRWVKLVEAQVYHDEYRFVDWSKPLWYALTLTLGLKGRRVNSDSAESLVEKTRGALMNGCLGNGLFPGFLNASHAPMVFEEETDRDNYWHSTFETPYVLWTHCNTDPITTATKQPSPGLAASNMPSGNPSNTKDTARIGQQYEKTIRFTNITLPDQTRQVAVLDDWLQDASPFLTFNAVSNSDDSSKKEEDALFNSSIREDPSSQSITGVVIDIPRKSQGKEHYKKQQSTDDMRKALKAPRTGCESKKRIIWLLFNKRLVARELHAGTSGLESDNVLFFLHRHAQHKNYFLDSTIVELNEWETELHLSFSQLTYSKKDNLYCLEENPPKYLSIATTSLRFSGDFSDRYWTCYFLEHGLEHDESDSLELRLQRNKDHGLRWMKQDMASSEKKDKKAERRDRQWQQRKVLELLIYITMLSDLYDATASILETVKKLALGPKKNEKSKEKGSEESGQTQNPFSRAIEEAKALQKLGDESDYSSIAERWRQYIQILLVIEENLTDNIDKMKEWDRREEDRRGHNPRWSTRDQRMYFTTVLRLSIMSRRKFGDIQRLKSDIHSFRESLPRQLETIRNDISFRGSQSINLFTYVTVVFLPLGFATGVLSMNQLPSRSITIQLVTIAFAALGITLFALLNAESVKKAVSQKVKKFQSFQWKLITLLTFLIWRLPKYILWLAVKLLLGLYRKTKDSLKRRRQQEKAKSEARSAGKQKANKAVQAEPKAGGNDNDGQSIKEPEMTLQKWVQNQYTTISTFEFREAWKGEKREKREKWEKWDAGPNSV